MNSPPPDDPFAPSDATILRPRPGRRPAGPGPAPPAGLAARQAAPPPGLPGGSASLDDFISAGGLNPLVQAAVPLLVLAGRLRGQIANADVESLRRQCVQEVRAFEDRARQAG